MKLAEPPIVEPASPVLREYYRVVLQVLRRGGGQPENARYMDEVLLTASPSTI